MLLRLVPKPGAAVAAPGDGPSTSGRSPARSCFLQLLCRGSRGSLCGPGIGQQIYHEKRAAAVLRSAVQASDSRGNGVVSSENPFPLEKTRVGCAMLVRQCAHASLAALSLQFLVETAMLAAVTGLAFLLATILRLDSALGYLLPLPVVSEFSPPALSLPPPPPPHSDPRCPQSRCPRSLWWGCLHHPHRPCPQEGDGAPVFFS